MGLKSAFVLCIFAYLAACIICVPTAEKKQWEHPVEVEVDDDVAPLILDVDESGRQNPPVTVPNMTTTNLYQILTQYLQNRPNSTTITLMPVSQFLMGLFNTLG